MARRPFAFRFAFCVLRFSCQPAWFQPLKMPKDRKSTRLNSSHGYSSYAVFCLKKKKPDRATQRRAAGDAPLLEVGRERRQRGRGRGRAGGFRGDETAGDGGPAGRPILH